MSGGSGNDTISGLLGTTGSYSVGDNVIGGAGTDTLNLIAAQHTANGLVSMDGVENVNVRLIGTAAETVELNAADWSGVAVLSNASSLFATTLEVSGVESAANITLYGNTDISIGYASTTTANAVGTIVDAGTFAGATDIFASATANATAHLDFDLENAGLVSGIAVTISGTNNYARLEGGSNAEAYTVNGAGNATLVTDDLVVSFNAAAAAGNVDVTFQAASEVVAVGGAGNDTVRLGTTFSNGDSFDGGAGTDTIRATVAGFNRNLNTTNVENAVLTFSDAAGGDVNASGSTVTSFTFAAGTADNAASVSQIANGATITLNDDSIGAVTLDYASGATTTTLKIGSVSGTVGIGTLAITDVADVAINAVGVSGSVGGTIGTASFDSDLRSLAITTSGGEADLVIGSDDGDVSLGGATSLTVTSNGSASIAMATADLAGTALATVTVAANGTDLADITLGDISGAALSTINLSGASGADVTVGTLDLGAGGTATTAGSLSLNVTQGVTSNIAVGNIAAIGQDDLAITFTQNATGGSATLGTITLTDTGTGDAVADLSLNAVAVAENGQVNVGAISVTTGTGAQVSIGNIVVGKDGYFGISGIGATGVLNADVSAITVDLGASAEANFGVISTTGGALGAVAITLAAGATATFSTVTASAVGAISLNLATGAGAAIGNIGAVQTVGSLQFGGVDGATATVGTFAASAVGAIAVSGGMDVTIGAITATTIGEVNNTQQGASGAFTINLSGVTNAVEVKLGAATNTVISGIGNDVITLTSGSTGNDNIQFTTATQGTDNVIGFGAGTTGADQIELEVGTATNAGLGGTGGLRDADGAAVATGTVSVDLSVVINGTGASASLTTADNMIVLGTAFAGTAGMVSFMQTAVSLATAALVGSGSFAVSWTDGTDTYVSLISFDNGASGHSTLASATLTTNTLAVIQGVTPGALVAANFDFV